MIDPCPVCGTEMSEPHYCYRIEESGKVLQRMGVAGFTPLCNAIVVKNGTDTRTSGGLFLDHSRAREWAEDTIARWRAHDELCARGHDDAAALVWSSR